MCKSDTLTKIAPALAKAQSAFKKAEKDSANPFFKSKYADLESIWAACSDALSANGIVVLQFGCKAPDGYIGIETVLLHESGEYWSGEQTLPMSKADPQGAGSAITYLRRYSLAAALGIIQTDDDGEQAMRRERKLSEVDAMLSEVGELLNGMKPDEKTAVRGLVFNDKTAAQIKAMPKAALQFAIDEIYRYIKLIGDDPDAFWESVKSTQVGE